MFIYGGIDDRGNYLSDMWILDLFNFIWLKVQPKSNFKTPAIAYHSSAMVYATERREHQNFKFFNFSDKNKQKLYKKVFTKAFLNSFSLLNFTYYFFTFLV